MNNAVFGKTMKNVRNQRNVKLVATRIRRNYFLSEIEITIEKKQTQHEESSLFRSINIRNR